MKAPKLPTSPSRVWPGGFALQNPSSTSSIAVAGGTVLAGGEELYLLRQGATKFATRELPKGMGDAIAVAVDPRCRGRMIIAGLFDLAILEGDGITIAKGKNTDSEFSEFAWGPGTGKRGSELYIAKDDGTVLRHSPGARGFDELDLPSVRAIATDNAGLLAYVSVDEEDDWGIDVCAHTASGLIVTHNVEAPTLLWDVHLARMGDALAVGFGGEKVWLTRRLTEPKMMCVEALSGGPLAFEGPDAASALFGVSIGETVTSLMRVDASGVATSIGEFGVPEAEKGITRVHQLAWDATRKTLWAAVGKAGVLSSTAPGAPVPGAATLS